MEKATLYKEILESWIRTTLRNLNGCINVNITDNNKRIMRYLSSGFGWAAINV